MERWTVNPQVAGSNPAHGAFENSDCEEGKDKRERWKPRDMEKINLQEKLSLFSEHWTPKIVDELNDYQIKLVKIQGEFVWHDHADTDELFLVVEGEMEIEFEDHTMALKAGEMCVVPKGVRHKPKAENECKVMLIEPRGVVNTGEAEGELTADNDVWI